MDDAATAEKNSDNQLKQRVAQAKTDILDAIGTQVINQASTIHNIVAGSQGTTPLYETYADAVKSAHRFLSYLDSDAVQARIDYYQSAQYLQQLLVVAYCNAGRGLHEDADAAIKTFNDNMTNEKRFRVIPIPRGIVIDQKTRLAVWVENLPLVSGFDSWDSAIRTTGLGVLGWRPASLGDLISYTKANPIMGFDPPANPDFGIFTNYDSQGGTVSPSQWLMNNGCYQDLGAIRLWTSQGLQGFWSLDITNETTLNSPQLLHGNDVAHNLLVHRIGVDHDWGSNFDDSLLITNGDAAGSQTTTQFDPVVIAQSLMTDVVKDSSAGDLADIYGGPANVTGTFDPASEYNYRRKAWLYRIAMVIIALQECEKNLISPNFSAVRESFQSKAFAVCPEQTVWTAVQDLRKIYWADGYSAEEMTSNRRARVAAWLKDVPLGLGPFNITENGFMKFWGLAYDSICKLLLQKIAPWYQGRLV